MDLDMGRLFKRYKLFPRLFKTCGCTGLREEEKKSNSVWSASISNGISRDYFFKVPPVCDSDPMIYHLWTALCKQYDLVSPPLPSSLWDFPGWAESFHPNSKQDQVPSLVTSFPPHPLQNLHLRIYEVSKTGPDLFVVCRSWKEPERKSTIPKPQEF